MSFADGGVRLFPVCQLFRRLALRHRVRSRFCAPPIRSLYDIDGRIGQGLVLASITSCVSKLVADVASCVCYGIWKGAGQVEHLCFGGPKIVRDNVEDPIRIKGMAVVNATLLDWICHLLMISGFRIWTMDVILNIGKLS